MKDVVCLGYDGNIKCGSCAENYVHPASEGPAFRATFREEEVRIPLWCEHGHTFDLVLAFHKGFTYVTYENVKDADISTYW